MTTSGDGSETGKRPKPPGLVHTWAPKAKTPAPPPAPAAPTSSEADSAGGREPLIPEQRISAAPIVVDGAPGDPRLPKGSRTLAGLAPVVPSQPPEGPRLRKPSSGAEALFRAKGGRVTLDLSGSMLPLPGESRAREPTPEPDSDALPLALDDVPISERDTEPEPKRDLQTLELDLPEEPKRAPHDAWTVDRKRRSTPAPMSTPGDGIFAPWLPASARLPKSPLTLDAPQGALDLVDRNRPSSPDLDLAGEMAERYALGDFTGALKAAEFMLGRNPNDANAQRYARSSRERLEQLYSSRLGNLERVPVVIVPDRSVRWLGLDHRAGFLLSRIDGTHTIDEIVDVSGMQRLEALKTLVELLDLNAIRLEDPR